MTRKTYTFTVPDFDDCGGRTMRLVEVPNKVVREIEAAASPALAEAAKVAVEALEAAYNDTPGWVTDARAALTALRAALDSAGVAK